MTKKTLKPTCPNADNHLWETISTPLSLLHSPSPYLFMYLFMYVLFFLLINTLFQVTNPENVKSFLITNLSCFKPHVESCHVITKFFGSNLIVN